MRDSRTPLLLIVALGSVLTGLGLGYVAFSGPGAEPPAGRESVASRPVGASSPASPSRGASAPELAVPAARAVGSASGPASRSAEVPRSRELPVAPVLAADGGGVGAITGVVRDFGGRGLEGVAFELRPPSGSPRYRPRSTESDAEGRFEFRGLPEGRWSIVGRHERWVVQRLSNLPELLPTGADVQLVGFEGQPVEVRVSGPGAERARLQVDGPGAPPEWAAWSPESPTVVLAPGSYTFRACCDPVEDWSTDGGWFLAPLASERVEVVVGRGDAAGIDLVLAPRDALYGVFKLPQGLQADRQRATVAIAEPDEGRASDFYADGIAEFYDRVDELGRYAFLDLERPDWTLGLQLDRGSIQSARAVRAEGPTRLDVALDPSELDEYFIVSVRTPAGTPLLRSVEFRVVHTDGEEGERPIYQSALALLQPDGTYRVSPMPFRGGRDTAERALEKRERRLQVEADGYAQAEVPAPVGTSRVDVLLEPDVRLIVNFTGPDAENVERESELRGSRLSEGPGRGRLRGDYEDDEEGLLADGLTPGRWELEIESEYRFGGSYREETLFRGEIELVPGDNRLEVPLPARSDLVVLCPGVKPETYLSLEGPLFVDPEDEAGREEADGNYYAQVGDDERVRFLQLQPGRYRLELGPAIQLVSVPSGEIEFAGTIPDAYQFVVEPDSALARAGLRTGDVFQAFDGQPMGLDGLYDRLYALSTQANATGTFTVLRNGSEVQVVLSSADLGEDEEFDDVDLEPVLN